LKRKTTREPHHRRGRGSLNSTPVIVDLTELRDRVGVFRNRTQAGKILAGMLDSFCNTEAIVLAIPSGGVPVAKVIAEPGTLKPDMGQWHLTEPCA